MAEAQAAELNRIRLKIQRLMDSDTLLEEEAATLMAEMDRAVASAGQAGPESIDQLVQRLKPLAGGQTVIEALDGSLNRDNVAGDADR